MQPELWQVDHGPQPRAYAECSPADQVEDYVRKPAMYMPRWASRITLQILHVRLQRVQEICDWEAMCEGVKLPERTVTMYHGLWRDEYAWRWDDLNAKRGFPWSANPWVWVLEFKQAQG